MQSGKFFSNEVLKELEVLKEDSNIESQIDEAPLGFGAGLGQRALATFGLGQSTRAAAKGKLEVGKLANQLYKSYYQWLQTQTPATPSKENILRYMQTQNIPTTNASKILTQAEADNANKEKAKKAASQKKMAGPMAVSPFAPKTSQSTVTQPVASQPTAQTVDTNVSESLNDILRLSGLPEVLVEALTNDQISKAFTAATGEFVANAQAQDSPGWTSQPSQAPASSVAQPAPQVAEPSSAVPSTPAPSTPATSAGGEKLDIGGNIKAGFEAGSKETDKKPTQAKWSAEPLKDFDEWLTVVSGQANARTILVNAARKISTKIQEIDSAKPTASQT